MYFDLNDFLFSILALLKYFFMKKNKRTNAKCYFSNSTSDCSCKTKSNMISQMHNKCSQLNLVDLLLLWETMTSKYHIHNNSSYPLMIPSWWKFEGRWEQLVRPPYNNNNNKDIQQIWKDNIATATIDRRIMWKQAHVAEDLPINVVKKSDSITFNLRTCSMSMVVDIKIYLRLVKAGYISLWYLKYTRATSRMNDLKMYL